MKKWISGHKQRQSSKLVRLPYQQQNQDNMPMDNVQKSQELNQIQTQRIHNTS